MEYNLLFNVTYVCRDLYMLYISSEDMKRLLLQNYGCAGKPTQYSLPIFEQSFWILIIFLGRGNGPQFIGKVF